MSSSAITNGLKKRNPRTDDEIPSRGRIVPDNRSKILLKEIDARTPVSSDVNRYPIPIPRKVKIDAVRNKIKATEGKAEALSPKKKSEIPKIITSSMMMRIKFVT